MNKDDGLNRAVYWCESKGISMQVKLTSTDDDADEDGEVPSGDMADLDGQAVIVIGKCPYHVIATELAQGGTTVCGGFATHFHDMPLQTGTKATITKASKVFDYSLVTAPMPLDILIKSPELRRTSLYTYLDDAFMNSDYAAYRNLSSDMALDCELSVSQENCIPNPACHRLIQQLETEKRWRLDAQYQWSLDAWETQMDQQSVLLNKRAGSVPTTRQKRYMSIARYQVSFGFATEFQRKMWTHFLDNDLGPCYLDAAFDLRTDGFQLWTLFFELDSQPVPISYLVTTAITAGLLGQWLMPLVVGVAHLPKKHIFINTFQFDEIGRVFDTWEIHYSKYCITQLCRKSILRGPLARSTSSSVASAVMRMHSDFDSALKKIREAEIRSQLIDFVFDHEDDWRPRSAEAEQLFAKSDLPVIRWNYYLWATMLSRPHTMHIDSVLYYLTKVIEPEISELVRCGSASSGGGCGGVDGESVFDFIELENDASYHAIKLDNDLFCVVDPVQNSKTITDAYFNVCYCRDFADCGICEHLIIISLDRIHHPANAVLLGDLPYS